MPMKVTIWFSPSSPWPGEIQVYNNITEIHFDYNRRTDHARDEKPRIAFESDIDCTGYTYATSDIAEFEAEEEQETCDEYHERVLKEQEFTDAMQEIVTANTGDLEQLHFEADALLCKTLTALGYEEGIKVFKKAPKWYA